MFKIGIATIILSIISAIGISIPVSLDYKDNYIYSNNYIIEKSVESTSLGVIVVDGIIQSDNVSKGQKNAKNEAFCSCILFVKSIFSSLQGHAIYSPKYLWQNYKEFGLQKFDKPMINFLVITKDNPYLWHIGIIIKKTETEIILLENNYIPCTTATRSLDINSNLIVGYLY